MILLNFSHPLTEAQLAAAAELTAEPIERVVQVGVHFDHQAPFLPQLAALMDGLDLTPQELQTAALLVNPPALNFITALLLAELHGRLGYFPAVLRLRPVSGATPPRFEVAEILNLQQVRDAARAERF
jgi:hypothetical protein